MPTPTCDACLRPSRDLRSTGRDANGDPDAPDLCFLCRVEGSRGRLYDRAAARYVRPEQDDGEDLAECPRCASPMPTHAPGDPTSPGTCPSPRCVAFLAWAAEQPQDDGAP